MGMPHEGSIFCDECGCFNLQATNCVIIDGLAYCDACLEKFKLKKKFNEIKKGIKSAINVRKENKNG